MLHGIPDIFWPLICQAISMQLQTNQWPDWARIWWANTVRSWPSLINFWSNSTELLPFPGLLDWLSSFHVFVDKPLIAFSSNLVDQIITGLSTCHLMGRPLTLILISGSLIKKNIWQCVVMCNKIQKHEELKTISYKFCMPPWLWSWHQFWKSYQISLIGERDVHIFLGKFKVLTNSGLKYKKLHWWLFLLTCSPVPL